MITNMRAYETIQDMKLYEVHSTWYLHLVLDIGEKLKFLL